MVWMEQGRRANKKAVKEEYSRLSDPGYEAKMRSKEKEEVRNRYILLGGMRRACGFLFEEGKEALLCLDLRCTYHWRSRGGKRPELRSLVVIRYPTASRVLIIERGRLRSSAPMLYGELESLPRIGHTRYDSRPPLEVGRLMLLMGEQGHAQNCRR